MLEITLNDSNFPHQEYLTPYLRSNKIIWKRDNQRRPINFYTDNFIKSSICTIPNDGKINVCLLLEPYTNPPWTDIYSYIRTDFEKFDLVITHNKQYLGDLIQSRPDKFFYSTKCITTSWLNKDMIGVNSKTKNISFPLSHKAFSEGHQLRHAIYEKYKNTKVIDFHGTGVSCYSNAEFRDCYTQYKYVVVCENTLQDGFNSEKLNDAFLTGSIPIYWGSEISDLNYDSKSIFSFSPKNTNIINFNFDESLSNLQIVLDHIIKTDPYQLLLDSINHNFNYAYRHYQSENNIYDILILKGYI
jgi:hypothetical protein